MMKFLTRFGIFLFLTLVLYVVVLVAFSFWKDKKGYSLLDRLTGNAARTGTAAFWQFHEARNPIESVDVLVFGSSYAFRAFDPREFRKNGLNLRILATSAQPPFISYYLIKDFVPVINPKLVIFDVCFNCFGSKGVESYFDLIKNTPVTSSLFDIALLINQLPVYHHFFSAMIIQSHRSLYQDLRVHRPRNYMNGFLVDNRKDKALDFNYRKRAYRIKELDDQQEFNLGYLEKIMKYARENNIRMVLTRQPNLWIQSFSLQVRITSLARKYHIPYIDLDPAKYRLDPQSDFYDRSHLNTNGAAKISTILLEEKLKPDPEFRYLWKK